MGSSRLRDTHTHTRFHHQIIDPVVPFLCFPSACGFPFCPVFPDTAVTGVSLVRPPTFCYEHARRVHVCMARSFGESQEQPFPTKSFNMIIRCFPLCNVRHTSQASSRPEGGRDRDVERVQEHSSSSMHRRLSSSEKNQASNHHTVVAPFKHRWLNIGHCANSLHFVCDVKLIRIGQEHNSMYRQLSSWEKSQASNHNTLVDPFKHRSILKKREQIFPPFCF